MGFDEAAALADSWRLLRNAVPEAWLPGFMFMGQVGERYDYKHGITREYLRLKETPDGTVVAIERTPQIDRERREIRYSDRELPVAEAIEAVYVDIERFRCTRESRYDQEFRALRDSDLARLGYRSLTVDTNDGINERSLDAVERALAEDRPL